MTKRTFRYARKFFRYVTKLPFGEEIAANIGGRSLVQGYGGDKIRQKFTGYQRGNESGLDYAKARYYSKQHGRFTSPDLPFMDQYEGDAQSWNLYTYAGNNPLIYTDPLGLWKRVSCTVNGREGQCYEPDSKDDTWGSLAKLINSEYIPFSRLFGGITATAGGLADYFSNQEITLGQTYVVTGYNSFVADKVEREVGWVGGIPGGGGVRPSSRGSGIGDFFKRAYSGARDFFKGKKQTPKVPLLRQEYENAVRAIQQTVDDMYKGDTALKR